MLIHSSYIFINISGVDRLNKVGWKHMESVERKPSVGLRVEAPGGSRDRAPDQGG